MHQADRLSHLYLCGRAVCPAGVRAFGSFFSRRLLAGHPGRWPWIFLALVAYGGAFLAFCQPLFAHLLQYALPWRWIAATVLIFPLGFFMGMPFPLGIAALDRCFIFPISSFFPPPKMLIPFFSFSSG